MVVETLSFITPNLYHEQKERQASVGNILLVGAGSVVSGSKSPFVSKDLRKSLNILKLLIYFPRNNTFWVTKQKTDYSSSYYKMSEKD